MGLCSSTSSDCELVERHSLLRARLDESNVAHLRLHSLATMAMATLGDGDGTGDGDGDGDDGKNTPRAYANRKALQVAPPKPLARRCHRRRLRAVPSPTSPPQQLRRRGQAALPWRPLLPLPPSPPPPPPPPVHELLGDWTSGIRIDEDALPDPLSSSETVLSEANRRRKHIREDYVGVLYYRDLCE